MTYTYTEKNSAFERVLGMCQSKEKASLSTEQYSFPLEDILLSFYKQAEIVVNPFSWEQLEHQFGKYCLQHEESVDFDLDECVEKGYILRILDTYESAVTHYFEFLKEKDLEKKEIIDLSDYPDGAIIRFLVWLRIQKYDYGTVAKLDEVQSILNSFSRVYSDTPDSEWFISNQYLYQAEDGYYLGQGRGYESMITHAMARLWIDDCRSGEITASKLKHWLALAGCVEINAMLMDYLDPLSGKMLVEGICRYILCSDYYPDWKSVDRFYNKIRILETCKYAKEPEKYKDIRLFCGVRLIDQENYEQYGFEYLDHFSYGWNAVVVSAIQPVLYHLEWIPKELQVNVLQRLNQLDRVGCLFSIYSLPPSSIMTLAARSETLFFTFRLVMRLLNEETEYGDFVWDQAGMYWSSLISKYAQQQDVAWVEEILLCSGYLFKRIVCQPTFENKTNRPGKLLQKIFHELSKEEYLCKYKEQYLKHFRELLSLEPVALAHGYAYIQVFLGACLEQNTAENRYEVMSYVLDLIWNGFKMLLSSKTKAALYYRTEYLTDQICQTLYEKYIKDMTGVNRIAWFSDLLNLICTDDRALKAHQYRLLLDFSYRIYRQNQEDNKSLRQNCIMLLEEVLINNHELFDYDYMQIYRTTKVVQDIIAVLSCEDTESKRLIEFMKSAPVADQIVYYDAASDEALKSVLMEAIKARADQNSLKVFQNDFVIELILNHHISCLYEIVDTQLRFKLERWKKKGISEQMDFVEMARNQYYWLLFLKGMDLQDKGSFETILRTKESFFHAIIYMESPEHQNLEKAEQIWMMMLRERKCYPAVYINYMLLLCRQTNIGKENEASIVLQKKAHKLIELAEQRGFNHWNKEQMQRFYGLYFTLQKRLKVPYEEEFFDKKKAYRLQISLEQMWAGDDMEETEERKGPEINPESFSPKNMIAVLCRFAAASFYDKSKLHYLIKNVIIDHDNQDSVFQMETILRTLEAIQQYGSQLSSSSKVEQTEHIEDMVQEEGNYGKSETKIIRLYESNVSQLFTIIYNFAYGEIYQIRVAQEVPGGTKGTELGGHLRSVPIDFQFNEAGRQSIMEAFVMNATTSKSVFKDHMQKILGNNIQCAPYAFMLIYGNAKKLEVQWNNYISYLANDFQKEFAPKGVVGNDLIPLKESRYFSESVTREHTGMNFQAQRITYDGREYEILHILADITKLSHLEIRK